MALYQGGSASLDEHVADDTSAQEEPVFEIRDFTSASAFERLAHRASLALRRWATDLEGLESSLSDVDRVHAFEHEGVRCELSCHHSSSSSSKSSSSNHRRSNFAPMGAHRLERWFGTKHTATLTVGSVRDNADMDDTRMALSALVLAAASRRPLLTEVTQDPLACFVVIEGGRWQRLLGERKHATMRTVYATDRAGFVDDEFRGGPTVTANIFREKFALNAGVSVKVAMRDTFTSNTFRERSATARSSGKVQNKGGGVWDDSQDPVGAVQLESQGIDESGRPMSLQSWIRVLAAVTSQSKTTPVQGTAALPAAPGVRQPLAMQLARLASFNEDASKLCSVDQWHNLPENCNVDAATSATLEKLAARIAVLPVSPSQASSFQALRPRGVGAPKGSMFSRYAETVMKLPDLRTALSLWFLILRQLRLKLEMSESYEAPVSPPSPSVPCTRKVNRMHPGLRCERIGTEHCLLQQKLELLQACLQRRQQTVLPRSGLTCLTSAATGAPVVAPPLLPPRLVTEDMEAEWKLALSAMESFDERVSFAACEFSSDASAFKAANPGVELSDFLRWRQSEGLDAVADGDDEATPFPEGWQEYAWYLAPPRPAIEQPLLFIPELEAEKVLHSLESIETTQFLIQIFRTRLWAGVDELLPRDDGIDTKLEAMPNMTCLVHAFTTLCEGVSAADAALHSSLQVCPANEQLQELCHACDRLENLSHLASSLREKLELMGVTRESNSRGTDFAETRGTLGRLILQAASTSDWRELECALDATSINLPAANFREYVIEVSDEDREDCGGKEHDVNEVSPGALYLEIGIGHVRLATSHNVPIT